MIYLQSYGKVDRGRKRRDTVGDRAVGRKSPAAKWQGSGGQDTGVKSSN